MALTILENFAKIAISIIVSTYNYHLKEFPQLCEKHTDLIKYI